MCPSPKNMGTVTLISHTKKVFLKILQARLQQYMNCELADVKLELEKVQEPEIKLPTSYGLEKKQENSRKKYLFLLYHSKLCKILQEMGLSDHLTCLLRNLYAGQEATVRTGHGTTDWFQIGKGVCQGCILSPCRLHHAKCWASFMKHKLE